MKLCQRFGLLILICCNTTSLIAQPATIAPTTAPTKTSKPADLEVGTVQLLDGYSQERTGTKDSQQGEIKRANSKFVVHYDIGFSAGTHMHPGRKQECVWYREQQINDRKVCVGLVKNEGGRELVVTIYGTTNEAMKFPANFWSQVQIDEDIADTLLMAISYEAKAGPR